jgi:hypothetical protein
MWPDNRLCPAAEGRGGTWNNRGEIVFGSRTTGLLRVQASGGTATALTNLTDTQKAKICGQPPLSRLLARQRAHCLCCAVVADRPGATDLASRSPPSSVAGNYFQCGIQPRPHLPRPCRRHVAGARLQFQASFSRAKHRSGSQTAGFDGQFNYAAFSVSPQGTIAYEEGTGSTSNELVRLDRTGKDVSTRAGTLVPFTDVALRGDIISKR